MKKEQGRRSGEGAATQETEVAERKLGPQKKQPLQPKLQKLHRPEEEQERKETEKKEKKEKREKEKESVAQQDGNATGDEDRQPSVWRRYVCHAFQVQTSNEWYRIHLQRDHGYAAPSPYNEHGHTKAYDRNGKAVVGD